MKESIFFILSSAGVLLIACSPALTPLAIRNGPVVRPTTSSADLVRGETLFNANCASCHGLKAVGTAQGPSFIDVIYEPNHHADAAFVLAVQRGVAAHHWKFGDMPPQPQVTIDEVRLITAYVRSLQQAAGIQ